MKSDVHTDAPPSLIHKKLRGKDSNLRPSGYGPDELPLLHPAKLVTEERFELSRPFRTSRFECGASAIPPLGQIGGLAETCTRMLFRA